MVSTKQLYEDVAYLTQVIGVRLAGSENERRAAEYLQKRFLEYVPKCWLEEFPMMERRVRHEELELLVDGQWKRYKSLLYNLSPSTNGKTIEAGLVVFESEADINRKDLSYLKGKAVLHYGSFTSNDHYRRLIEAKPAFLIMVDTRYTSEVCIGNGLLPANVEAYGAVPITGLAFTDAWNICARTCTRARLTADGGAEPGVSCNVVAELPGTDPNGDILYCGAHMDGVADSPAADDNATSCAILLELARLLAQKPHRHTIRLIAFGTEEQLSVGSATYVRTHRQEIEQKGRFMCNFDSCSSIAGWFYFILNADGALTDRLTRMYNHLDVYFRTDTAPDPYNDLFAFTAAGVPGITHMRKNCSIGRFYHHQSLNTIDMVSMDVAGKLVTASAALLTELADGEHLSYGLNQATKAQVANMWETTYGGWNL